MDWIFVFKHHSERKSMIFVRYGVYSRIYVSVSYTIPCAIMALATFKKPAMFAPFT